MISADELRQWREKVGLSQSELARIIGVHPMTISKQERGILRVKTHPSLQVLDLLFRAKLASNLIDDKYYR